MMLLTLWVAGVAIQIERVNAEAGYYLPGRHGDNIGKWRLSRDGLPRDRLRGLVSGSGLLQYPLGLAVIGLAFSHFVPPASRERRWAAVCCGIVGMIAIGLGFYRQYFASLGW
jgi:hypothetical protein